MPAPRPEPEPIVITGTRIHRPNLESPVPMTSLSGDEVLANGSNAIGDTLNDLPQLRNTSSQGNSGRVSNQAGLNLLDLRGLDPVRTLVLQNGRRLVGATEGSNRVDANIIPTDLVERVDVVTGGTSAVYGSDALAGVVNFVLRRDFEGFQARTQVGFSSRGDRTSYRASITAGQNFAGGRGNIAGSVEYSNSDEVGFLDRPDVSGAFAGRAQFQLSQCTGTVVPNPLGQPPTVCSGERGSDGIPDRTFYPEGIRSLLLSEGGSFLFYSGTNTAVCAQPTNPLTCIQSGPSRGLPRVFRFNPDGTVREADYGEIDFRTINGTNQLGGDGSTQRRYGTLIPGLERLSVNVIGHYDLAPGVTPYFEAKYARVDAFQEYSPIINQTGANATTVIGGNTTIGIPIRITNPFLSDQAREFIQARLPAGQTSFRLQRVNLDFGASSQDITRETYRAVVGVEGVFNGDWRYDVSLNYGRLETRTLTRNNRLQQRFELAIDPVRDPASGAIVCRARTPGGAPALLPETDAFGRPIPVNIAKNAALVADIAACVPVNVFGEGAPSAEALAYINADSFRRGHHNQYVASAYLSGDTSDWFELPGGPIGFVIGTEYRRETAFAAHDDIVSTGLTAKGPILDFDPPAFAVKEAFAEIDIPLLRDRPLFQELSLQAAARVADYRGSTGTVLAWNVGGGWSPMPGLRFRAAYAVAVRAPNLNDLYNPATRLLAPVADPCDTGFIGGGSPTRAANCLAAGIPVGFVNTQARAAATETLTGGNPNLVEERSKSLTVGAVLQPRFVQGLSITVDYYDITIDDVITTPTALNLVNACYDAPTLDNVFCPLISRDPVTHFFNRPGVSNVTLNYASFRARGIDLEASYSMRLGPLGRLSLRWIGTYSIQRDNFTFPSDPRRVDRILQEVGDPKFAVNFSADLRRGPLSVGYRMRWSDRQSQAPFIEDIRSVNGNPPANADYSNILWYPDTFYHDFRLGYDVDERLNVYAGVDNIGDQLPPYDTLGTGLAPADGIWSNTGRFFYVGAAVRF